MSSPTHVYPALRGATPVTLPTGRTLDFRRGPLLVGPPPALINEKTAYRLVKAGVLVVAEVSRGSTAQRDKAGEMTKEEKHASVTCARVHGAQVTFEKAGKKGKKREKVAYKLHAPRIAPREWFQGSKRKTPEVSEAAKAVEK